MRLLRVLNRKEGRKNNSAVEKRHRTRKIKILLTEKPTSEKLFSFTVRHTLNLIRCVVEPIIVIRGHHVFTFWHRDVAACTIHIIVRVRPAFRWYSDRISAYHEPWEIITADHPEFFRSDDTIKVGSDGHSAGGHSNALPSNETRYVWAAALALNDYRTVSLITTLDGTPVVHDESSPGVKLAGNILIRSHPSS